MMMTIIIRTTKIIRVIGTLLQIWKVPVSSLEQKTGYSDQYFL